jgi:hypothetical protein
VVASVVKLVNKLVTMFSPVGAIIQGIITIYNTITFFIERAQQIATVAEAESVGRIAAGDIAMPRPQQAIKVHHIESLARK